MEQGSDHHHEAGMQQEAGFSVTLTERGWTFAAPQGRSVLLAAEDAGVTLPNSCRNGTCRTCLCRLVSGSVTYLVAWPGLSADEKRDGYILPCVALAGADLVIEAPAARRAAG
jgi:ferredoxin